MREEALRRFLLLSLSAAAALGSFYLFFRYLLPWCLPFLIAALVASLLEPIVLRWQRTLNFRRGFSSLVLTLTLLFLLGGLLSLLWTTLLSQLDALLSAAPAFFDALPEAAEGLLARLERSGALRSPWLEGFLRERLLHAVSDADSLLRALSARAVSALTAAASALPGVLLAAATCVLAIFFTSASYPALHAAPGKLLPPKTLAALRRLRSGAADSLARWLRAQAMLSCVTFFELLLGFLLMRQRYALLLALAVGAVDRIRGNKKGYGEKFEEGFNASAMRCCLPFSSRCSTRCRSSARARRSCRGRFLRCSSAFRRGRSCCSRCISARSSRATRSSRSSSPRRRASRLSPRSLRCTSATAPSALRG